MPSAARIAHQVNVGDMICLGDGRSGKVYSSHRTKARCKIGGVDHTIEQVTLLWACADGTHGGRVVGPHDLVRVVA